MANLLGAAAIVPGVFNERWQTAASHGGFHLCVHERIVAAQAVTSVPFLKITGADIASSGVKTKGQVAIFPGCAFEFFFADIGKVLSPF